VPDARVVRRRASKSLHPDDPPAHAAPPVAAVSTARPGGFSCFNRSEEHKATIYARKKWGKALRIERIIVLL